MRPFLLTLGVALGAASPAEAMEEGMVFHMVRAELDAANVDDAGIFNWDAEAWIGGDIDKFWIKSEGAVIDGDAEDAEVQALWSRNAADFWDVQLGVRVDLEPDTRTYLAASVQGLAPYQFETEATAFVSADGDVSARLRQSMDVLFTQELVIEPHVEINAYAQDDREREVGAGLADAELGFQIRYEITRKLAPYVDVVWERALGETASLQRAAGRDAEESSIRAGLRFWF